MKKYVIITLTVSLLTVSCYKELDVTPPNAITNEQVLALLSNADDATRENILGGMAGSLPLLITSGAVASLEFRYTHYTGSEIMRGFEANDMVFGNSQITNMIFGADEYRWANMRTDQGIGNYWGRGWGWITAANKVLAFLPNEVVGNNTNLKRYRAQALLIRALSYNYLLENFQDAYVLGGGSKLGVPIYTIFDPAQPYQARATLDECYKLINTDLNNAIQDLGETTFTDVKNDIDAGVAIYLRARVALCMGNWQQAITDCQRIIARYGESFMSETQYVAQKEETDDKYQYYGVNSGFLNLAENPETIWGFFYTDGQAAAQSYWLNIYGTTQQGSTRGFNVQIDSRLYNQIADDDYRKKNFVGPAGGGRYQYADDGSQEIMPYANLKFASTVGKTGGTNPGQALSTNNQNDWTYIRLSEIYLMLAEAQAQSGNENAAKATLDKLIDARTNGAYNTDTYPSHAGLSTLKRIQLQTRIEMWGEKGLEFYNNRRWNIPADRTSGTSNHHSMTNIPVSEMTSLIPLGSINLNGLLQQNP